MDPKTQRIIEMLQESKIYTDIQSELNVSPTLVSKIRHEYAEIIDAARNETKKNDKIYVPSEKQADSPDYNQKTTNLDSATIIRMKELDCKLILSVKEMENQDKESERAHERELIQTNEENQRLRKLFEEISLKMVGKINDLEEKINDQRQRKAELEEEETEDLEQDDNEYFDDMQSFVSDFLDKDGERLDEEKMLKALEEITALKERFQAICRADGTDVTEYPDWDILTEAETDFQGFLKESKKNWLNSNPYYNFTKAWKRKLKGFLEEQHE